MEPRKPRRIFTPEQKVELIQLVESSSTIKQGCLAANIGPTQYRQWKKQYKMGIQSSLRNSRPLMDQEKKRLIEENRLLKATVLTLSIEITDLKKTVSY